MAFGIVQRLDHVKAFEFRMAERLRLFIAGAGMRDAKLLGIRPGREGFLVGPNSMRSIEDIILMFRPLQQTELDKARYFVKPARYV